MYGFNPCFGGCRSERTLYGRDGEMGVRVSILVLVDVALKVTEKRPNSSLESVSILVFVDVALKEAPTAISRTRILSFNPCFGGCRSESSKC